MENLDKTDYLEVDNPIPGQNYVCLSFISPENVIMDKQLFMFNKYMSQRCAEFENKLEEIVKEASDELRTSIQEKLVTELHESMKYGYEAFKSKFEDFKYKFRDPLEKQFNNQCNFKTNVRGIKVRGVYDTVAEANSKAKELQRQDRSFHIFVGQVGSWLPWDPCADRVENEEYLEEDLNTMMKKYKENEVARDMFYEEQKRDKIKAAMEERLKAEQQQKENAEAMEEPDPWMKSKFAETAETTEASHTEDLVVEDSSNSTTDNSDTTTDPNQVKEV